MEETDKIPDDTPDLDAEFESEEGRILTRENIALAVRYENVDVKKAPHGFVVDGELFQRLENE